MTRDFLEESGLCDDSSSVQQVSSQSMPNLACLSTASVGPGSIIRTNHRPREDEDEQERECVPTTLLGGRLPSHNVSRTGHRCHHRRREQQQQRVTFPRLWGAREDSSHASSSQHAQFFETKFLNGRGRCRSHEVSWSTISTDCLVSGLRFPDENKTRIGDFYRCSEIPWINEENLQIILLSYYVCVLKGPFTMYVVLRVVGAFQPADADLVDSAFQVWNRTMF